MSEPAPSTVDVNGFPCRVWRKGSGRAIGFLAGLGGLPRWTPFLDRLAESRTVVAPSLPGYPGATGHHVLDSHLDWVLAVHTLLSGAGLLGADLVGSSVGGAFAAEMAAIWPGSVRRLALIAPLGLFDEKEPVTDPWGQRAENVPGLMCADPAKWTALTQIPPGEDAAEWPIVLVRAAEAAARAFWPLGNTQLDKRLPRIGVPTLVLWGEHDRIVPRSYAERIAKGISGPTKIEIVPGAGHLAELDCPDAVARAVLDWTRDG